MKIEYTKNGQQRTINARVGKILIGRGLAREVGDAPASVAAPTYQTRMLAAAPTAPTVDSAPYGHKADGTPRKRPGRAPAVKASEEE